MQIEIEIDEELMRRAKSLTGIENKREIVETALSLLIRTRERDQAHATRGHRNWSNDPDALD